MIEKKTWMCDICRHSLWDFGKIYNHVMKKHLGHNPNCHTFMPNGKVNGMDLVPDKPRGTCELCPHKREFNL